MYPIVGYDFDIDSFKENLATVPLGLGLMICFFDNYLRNTADGRNTINSLVTSNLKGLLQLQLLKHRRSFKKRRSCACTKF